MNDSTESRFFIALLPPEVVQQVATSIKEDFRDRYDSAAALRSPPHVTLQPPFLWPPVDLPRLAMALAAFAAQYPPLPMTLSGFNAFPPRVIFIDVVKTPELLSLQVNLMQYMAAELGICDRQSSHRPFAPHLTIAFRDLKPSAFRKAWPELQDRPFHAEFLVSTLTLLRHTGQRWDIAQEFPLSHPAASAEGDRLPPSSD